MNAFHWRAPKPAPVSIVIGSDAWHALTRDERAARLREIANRRTRKAHAAARARRNREDRR